MPFRKKHWSAAARHLRSGAAFLFGLSILAVPPARAQVVNEFAALVPIDTAYAGNDINAVSFRQKSLTSVVVGNDTYQYAAYYRHQSGPAPNRYVTIARRLLGETEWDIFDTSFNDPNSNGTDSHNTISIGIDGDGYMHMSYGMHNDSLIYRKSTAPVTNSDPIAFGAIVPMIGVGGAANDENSVTYPQFYNMPDGDLLFFYRNGGSGNGNSFLNRYDTATDTWSAVQHPLFDGISSSVNAYPNTLAFDSQGDLHFTWTDRSTPAFQTNHNIYYARSPDNGVSWTKMDGSPYVLPITEATAEEAVTIPQNSTLINQTSMTIDKNDRPVVASWWAPDAASGNNTRQYMLAYFDGSDWQTSQITNRPLEPLQGDSTVRELARPIVMVDDDNRTIVVTRYKEANNVVTVAYSENKQDWNFVDLTAESLGNWEPTFDAELWQRENKLHLLYQPLGSTTSTISVLEWNAQAFFSVPPKLQVDRATGLATIVNPDDASVDISAYEITSGGSQLDPVGWSSLQDQVGGGWMETQSLPTALAEENGGGVLTLSPAGTAALGGAYAGQPIGFGVDAPGDLVFQATVNGEVRQGTVEYSGVSLNNLVLTVDPDTGLARLENMSPFSVSIGEYTITSVNDALDPTGFRGLDFQDADNGEWHEDDLTKGLISESRSAGATLLAGGDRYELGRLFDTSGSQVGVDFEFLVDGAGLAQPGVVLFASLGVPGDYNDDGAVNAADYTSWRNKVGSTAVLPNDLTPGEVTVGDYALWKANYGMTFNGGAGATAGLPGSAAAVPEPCTAALFVILALSVVGLVPIRSC